MGKVDLTYQENSLGSVALKKRTLTDAEREQMSLVSEMLGSKAYGILHKIMVEEMTSAEIKLCDKEVPLEDVRYYQGIVRAVQNIQHKILSLGTEEGYGNSRS